MSSISPFGEQRGADILLLLLLFLLLLLLFLLLLFLLLLWPCTESPTPWNGRSETCPMPRQNEQNELVDFAV